MLNKMYGDYILQDRLRSGDSLFISSKEYDGPELLDMRELLTG